MQIITLIRFVYYTYSIYIDMTKKKDFVWPVPQEVTRTRTKIFVCKDIAISVSFIING